MKSLDFKYKKMVWLTGLLIFCSHLNALPNLSKEQKLKSAYLLNFTRYISWSDIAKNAPRPIFKLCLQSSSPMFSFMQELVAVSDLKKHHPKVQVVAIEQAQLCHLSYIQSALSRPFSVLSDSLIVADSKNIKQPSTAITFFTEGRKLRFEIDLQVLQSSDLIVSSELLKLARIKR
ncbi:MAG: hypothetical protein ACI8R9_000430 [Paraglaciecola sp.]|jgi:hypothetical protein